MLKKTLFLLLFFIPGTGAATPTEPPQTESPQNQGRFFFMGDGVIMLQGESIRFRQLDGSYRSSGLKRINQIFRAPWALPQEHLSLRFIEILDYVQDQLQGKNYRLRSGYRSRRNNASLRKKGKLAAQSSMHIESAAGDLILVGVPSSQVFEFVKSLNCCGIGWYHSRHFHLDTGPPRYWDETSSKTGAKKPQQNEKIILQSNYDRYLAGAKVPLKYMRITEYPVGVPQILELVKLGTNKKKATNFIPVSFPQDVAISDHCRILKNAKQARSLELILPTKNLAAGKYTLKAKFCGRYNYESMPETIQSRPFEIIVPQRGKRK